MFVITEGGVNFPIIKIGTIHIVSSISRKLKPVDGKGRMSSREKRCQQSTIKPCVQVFCGTKWKKKWKHTFRSLRNFHSAQEYKVCTAEELRIDFKQHRLSSKWAVGTIRVQRKRRIWMGSKTMEKALSFHLYIEEHALALSWREDRI